MEDANFNKGLSVDDYFRKTDLIYLPEVNHLPALGPLGTETLFNAEMASFWIGRGEAGAYLQSGVRPWNWSLFWFHLLLPQSQLIVALHCNISWLIVSIPAVQERHLSYVCCLLPIWMIINNYSQAGRKHDKNYIDYKHSILSKEQSIFLVEILNLNVLT